MLLAGCGPIGPIAGGQLSGTEVPEAPNDWYFSDNHRTHQLETRPSDPYSVNVWGVGLGDRFYLASGTGGEAEWTQHIADDPNVRLRVGDSLYPLKAVRVEDAAERERFLEAMKKKYDDWEPEPEQVEAAWVFRLERR